MHLIAVLPRAVGAGALGGVLAGILAVTVVLVVGSIGSGEYLGLLAVPVLSVYGAVVGGAVGAVAGALFGLGMLPLAGRLTGERRRARVVGGLVGLVAVGALLGGADAFGMSGSWWWVFAVPSLIAGPVTGLWLGPWVVGGPRPPTTG